MKYFLVCYILFCISISNIPAQVFENTDLKISVLEDKIWVIVTSDHTTMYLVEGNKKALLIDTGTKCDSLDKVIRHITSKPLEVVITHGHYDHAGNIKYFADIYMHPADTFFLHGSYQGKIHFVKDGDIFDLGGKVIEVREMPGHTPGSIVLVDKQAKCCFTGDAFGSGLAWLQIWPIAPMNTFIASCSKMEDLMDNGIEKLYCGHYFYQNRGLPKEYMLRMKELAISIKNGTVKNAKPYPVKVSISCDNPMEAWNENAGIVFDPDNIK